MVQTRVVMLFLATVFSTASAFTQTAYQLFGPVNTRPSTNTAITAFGTSTLNLTCPGTVTAIITSSKTNTNANVFTDNYIGLTVNSNNRVNICRQGYSDAPEGGTDCFNQAYTSAYQTVVGQNPDNFVATYGVPALDISADLPPNATSQAKFELLDFGVTLGSSSVWLITNCTQNGIAPGGSLTGNPISSTTPPAEQLTQTFAFDSTTNQRVEFTADYSAAQSSGALNIVDGTTPVVSNQGLSPALWPAIVSGTSFATTTCVPDNGELDSNNNPLCKLSTIVCTNSQSSTPAGDNCPQSTAKNVRMFHTFDAPSNSVLNLPPGTGLGFLMGSDQWPLGGSCVFVGPEAGVMCPQNLLTSFLGDYSSGSGGRTTNSTFIVVAGVPLPSTTASFSPNNSGWSNSSTVNLNFVSTPPSIPSQGNNNFMAAAVQTLTYGIDSPFPYPDTSLPIPGDVTLPASPAACPLTPTYSTQALITSNSATLSEGSHVLHYFATDCAGTEELVFTPDAGNLGNWVTFKTVKINVDTTPPQISGPTLSPAGPYTLNQAVIASYSCTDPAGTSGAVPSGVTACGPPPLNSVGTTQSTGTLTSRVSTSAVGPQTFTVNVKDLAGNAGTPASVSYNVNYNYKGFLFPVSNPPSTNYVEAGAIVPFRFTLGGYQGLGILAGTPVSMPILCPGKTSYTPAPPQAESLSGLVYDPLTRVYMYAWKTNKLWDHTCRQFVIQLKDGTSHTANFAFVDD